MPMVILYANIELLEYFIRATTVDYIKYLPSMSGVSTQTLVLLVVTIVMVEAPKILGLCFKRVGDRPYSRFRLVIIMGTAGVACIFLPPDIIFALLAIIITGSVLELTYYYKMIKEEYEKQGGEEQKNEKQ